MARLIKRYANRKLYDTEEKSYVSLKLLGELVKQGEEIQVIEKESGEDITAKVLAKVIVQEDESGSRRLPKRFLHQIVRRSGRMVGSTVDQFEYRVEQLIQASLERWGLVKEFREKIDHIQGRLSELEKSVEKLNHRSD